MRRFRRASNRGRSRSRFQILIGRGSLPQPGVFDYIQSHFLEEPGRSRFVTFWRTADAISALPNRRLIPRLPEAYAHCLRESLGEIPKSGQREAGLWREVSRSVVAARVRYEAVRNLPGPDEAEALRALLEAIDSMKEFHDGTAADVRGLTNLIFEKTGARLIDISPHPAVAFYKVREKLQQIAHSAGGWEQVLNLRDQALAELSRLFNPPDVQLKELEHLAAISQPMDQEIARAIAIVTNEHHLRVFVDGMTDAGWLQAMGPHAILAPSKYSESWPVVRLVVRLASAHGPELVTWLESALARWGSDPNAAIQVAVASRVLGPLGHPLILELLERHSGNRGIRTQAEIAIDEADPTSDFVTEALRYIFEGDA